MKPRISGFMVGVVAISAAGALLRVMSAGRIGVFRDEGQSMEIMARESVSSILSFLAQHESHPPGYYLLGHLLHRLGLSLPDWLSGVSLACSIAVIPLVIWLTVKAFGRTAGVLAGLTTAFAPGLFLYSVQARPYALITLLVLSATGCLALFGRDGRRSYLGAWGALMALAATLHYTVLLYVGAQVIVFWIASQRARLPLVRMKELAVATCGLGVLLLPVFSMLVGQMQGADYEAVKPFSLLWPIQHLTRAAIDFPFEFGVPVAACVAIVAAWTWRAAPARAVDPGANPEAFSAFVLRWTGVAFIGLSFLGSYRSRLTLPHVMMTSVPFTSVLVATAIVGRFRSGKRVGAAVFVEVLLVCLAVSWILRIGYMKTNADLVARTVMASASENDLLILMPGLLGTSFNRTFDGRIKQIDFPYSGPTAPYKFDRYFERITDTLAWHEALAKARSTLGQGGAIWFVVQAGWHMDSVRSSLAIPSDSFAGIAQADVIRANQMQRALHRLAGPPDTMVPYRRDPIGYETLNLFRYATADSDAAELGGKAR